MFVTFISQCDKKAIKRTREVLDAFADRIGDFAWQTVITQEGLDTVKKLLRKSATKSTAVSCHWLRSRSRSELLWIIGNKNKFNSKGIVPVNYTEGKMDKFMDSSLWKTIDIIKYAAVIAGLFHDFGKANILFQNKLNPNKKTKSYEPYRHEWVSLRLFQTFVSDRNDQEWLNALSQIEKTQGEYCFKDSIDGGVDKNHPLKLLPPFAKLVAWLILCHHKLPLKPNWINGIKSESLAHIDRWFEGGFEAVWNSYNCIETDQYLIKNNWTFSEDSLPYQSNIWRSYACIISSEAAAKLKNLAIKDFLFDNIFTSHLARLSLMLADHYYSDQDETQKWQSQSYSVYANTHPKTKNLKQHLDEHLIGVAKNAGKIIAALPKLNRQLMSLKNTDYLEKRTPKEYRKLFGWQDEAKKVALSLSETTLQQGFFGINMASTGKGKTLANAKIMYALGDKTNRKRFSIALGLRALTLQTGREYQTKLLLNNEKLAIAVGGTAVKQLFENTQKNNESKQNNIDQIESGSESQEEYLEQDLYVDYNGQINEHSLSKWTKNNSSIEKLIQAPVLVCTIDHLIPATEGVKGGRQIAPMLRLLTSDLVIDEPDDFGLEDLPALCRLLHWAGMLGSRVLLSTATMPPALSYAAFKAYQAGWSQFAKANLENWNGVLNCAWFDEKNADSNELSDFETFKTTHEKFIQKRIKNLIENTVPKHKARITPVKNVQQMLIAKQVANVIQKGVLRLHKLHCQNIKQKNISIGLVRIANINPLVAIAKELLNMKVTTIPDTRIYYCVYHSHFPLAVRSYLENKLDHILKRNSKHRVWPPQELIKQIENHPEKNHIFIVLASPVAEVGRDHDYDWAIIEPSSMRSIIQIAGRVLRHREKVPQYTNILLLDKNIKCLQGKDRCFDRPGFECSKLELKMETHVLKTILNKEQYCQINAIHRITTPEKFKETATGNLVALEHQALLKQLFTGNAPAKIWWEKQPYWCGEVQNQQRFRDSKKDEALYLSVNDGKILWQWKNKNVYPAKWTDQIAASGFNIELIDGLTIAEGNQFWFDLNPIPIYEELAKDLGFEVDEIGKQFGEVRLVNYEQSNVEEYNYNYNLGLYKTF